MSNYRIIKAEKISRENLIRLTWSNSEKEDFLRTCGAIAWPRGGLPGIILMAGETPDKEVIVFEEKEFATIPELATFLIESWPRYSACRYFIRQSDDWAFSSDLAKIIPDKKRPLSWVPFSNNSDYGHQVIKYYLEWDKLRIPAGGILANQLSLPWDGRESFEKELRGIEALRYLLTGIKSCPWEPPPKATRKRLDNASLSALKELEAIKDEILRKQEMMEGWW